MSEFIEKDNHTGHTEALQAHLLHGKDPEAHPSLREASGAMGALPRRTGARATTEGTGVNYDTHVGHKAP